MTEAMVAHDRRERLTARLAEYRRERTDQPEFYYNELAERGQALARLREPLTSFLAGTTDLISFRQATSRFSRREWVAARGREQGRYWRLNSSGQLFVVSLIRQAEEQNQLNRLARELQAVLVGPTSLVQAGAQLDRLEGLLEQLGSGPTGRRGTAGSVAMYFVSYCWAVQSLDWPVYSREVRSELERLEGLETGQDLADSYSRFYQAFSRLAGQLELANWELESFLHWLSQHETSEAKAVQSLLHRPPQSATALKRSLVSLERLRQNLESDLRRDVAMNLRGTLGQRPEGVLLSFGEEGVPVRLELIRDGDGLRAGLGLDGFSAVVLSSDLGQNIVTELRNYIEARPEYAFFRSLAAAPVEPNLAALGDESWLLRPWLVQSETLLSGDLLDEWRLLYPFARRLVAEGYANFLEVVSGEPEDDSGYAYPSDDDDDTLERAVAEAGATYEVKPPPPPLRSEFATPAPESVLLQQSSLLRSEAARLEELEVQRLARFQPEPLSTEQADALTAFVRERLVIETDKILEVVTHLEAGRNVLLYGPPGCGKTRLARLIAGQMCARDPGWANEQEATNYTLATATAEWTTYDVIGGIRPGLASESIEELVATDPDDKPPTDRLQYFFEPGVVSRAALECEESLQKSSRPHYLIIDEFNRANQDRAFGELFTLLEYRDRPLLPAARIGRMADLYLPDSLRLLGTLNSDDRNTLFDIGQALRRRFALVEVDLPSPAAERQFLPKAVRSRLPEVALTASGDFADPVLQNALQRLLQFAAAVRPDPANSTSGGKKLGTAFLIECLVFCAVAARFYDDPTAALEDALLANVLPQLERARPSIERALKLVSSGGALSDMTRVRATLERMSGSGTYFG